MYDSVRFRACSEPPHVAQNALGRPHRHCGNTSAPHDETGGFLAGKVGTVQIPSANWGYLADN